MSNLREPHRHDDLLNYRLKRLLALGGAPAVRLCEGRFGLTRSQWRVLAALVEGGEVSPSELVSRIAMEPARLSRNVRELCDRGLAVRAAAQGDARRARVNATGEGVRLYDEILPCLAAINARLVSVLDAHELDVLDRCLDKLTCQARRVLAQGEVQVRADRRHGGSRRTWEAARTTPRSTLRR